MLTILVRVKILTDALASVASVWIRPCIGGVYIKWNGPTHNMESTLWVGFYINSWGRLFKSWLA